MSDSLYVKVLELDSKIGVIESSLNSLNSKSSISLWVPVIAALITAVIGTILAQAIDRIIKGNNDKNRDLRDVKSKCINSKIRLKGLFQLLAIYECDSAYWYHIYTKESRKDDHGYSEHVQCENKIKDVMSQIDITIADFLSEVSKYERIKGKRFDIKYEKELIENLEFRNMDYYPESLSIEDLTSTIAKQDKDLLKAEYKNNLLPFEEIINKMI